MDNALRPRSLAARRFFGRVALVALSLPCLAAAAPGPSPFDGLERTLREQAGRERARLEAAGLMKGAPELGSPLSLLEMNLHDIRNHRALWELWSRWGYRNPELRVLYVASGAHLAPLVFLHGPEPPRKVTYTFTELNPLSAVRIESLLAVMVQAGLYRDLAVEVAPAPGSRFAQRWAAERGEGAGPARSALEFARWAMGASEAMGIPPSFVARFRFTRGSTRAEIRLLVRVSDGRPGSTAYFNLNDLETADLAITHDWDYDPRSNLGVLLDFVEAHAAGSRARPLAVMMEDLRRYPFPVDMGLFHPVAQSDSGYGHQEFIRRGDGTKEDEEDGITLYGGGVILQPDTAYLESLPRAERTDFFNLALFAGSALARRNVDVIGGARVVAPALLDLGVGYAARDVRGEDLRGRPEFLAGLSRAAARLPGSRPPMPDGLRPLWCAAADRFAGALRAGKALELEPLIAQADRDLRENAFVGTGGSRATLQRFLADRAAMAKWLEGDRAACARALDVLESERDLLRGVCSPPSKAAPVVLPVAGGPSPSALSSSP